MPNLVITDPIFQKKDRLNGLDSFLMRFIKEERDLPFLHLILKMFVVIVPMAVVMFIPGLFRWWFAAIYLAINWIFFMGPYILMLHCVSHRVLFNKAHSWMNKIVPWFLGPFFGESPETYYGHHVGMHHPENNLQADLSSTMKYQRDSFFHFMQYFLTFFFIGIIQLYQYLTKKNRPKLKRNVIVGELGWLVFVVVLWQFNWQATLMVFIIPLIFTRFMMMCGNWGQHAFIDADAPANCYRNSLTCINSRYNHQCFNDGYHIVHHFHANMHFTDMPVEFDQNRATYAKEKAVIFEGVDFFVVWFLLMTKSYKTLAKKFVHLDDSYKNDEEVISFLKERVKKIPAEKMI